MTILEDIEVILEYKKSDQIILIHGSGNKATIQLDVIKTKYSSTFWLLWKLVHWKEVASYAYFISKFGTQPFIDGWLYVIYLSHHFSKTLELSIISIELDWVNGTTVLINFLNYQSISYIWLRVDISWLISI